MTFTRHASRPTAGGLSLLLRVVLLMRGVIPSHLPPSMVGTRRSQSNEKRISPLRTEFLINFSQMFWLGGILALTYGSGSRNAESMSTLTFKLRYISTVEKFAVRVIPSMAVISWPHDNQTSWESPCSRLTQPKPNPYTKRRILGFLTITPVLQQEQHHPIQNLYVNGRLI